MKYNSRTAIITGASSGIGREIAIILAKHNYNVALIARREKELLNTCEKIEQMGGNALAIPLDLCAEGAVYEAISLAKSRFGNIEIMVNCAAKASMTSFAETSDKRWDLVFRLNIRVPFQFARELLPDMQKNHFGWIINIASEAAIVSTHFDGAYGISKASLIKMTEILDQTYSNDNIHCVAICPGWVKTNAAQDPTELGYSENDILSTNDIAESVLWLLQQPSRVYLGPTISVLPLKRSARLRESIKVYLESIGR